MGSFSNDTMAHPQGDLICDKNNINLLFRSSSKFCKFWIFEHRLPPSCLKLMTSWKLKARERLTANTRVPEVSVSTARFCSEPTLCAPSDRKRALAGDSLTTSQSGRCSRRSMDIDCFLPAGRINPRPRLAVEAFGESAASHPGSRETRSSATVTRQGPRRRQPKRGAVRRDGLRQKGPPSRVTGRSGHHRESAEPAPPAPPAGLVTSS